MQQKRKIAGIIMAAGKGSRMVPLTLTTPKPLAKVGDRTLLQINMERIYPLVDYFIIVINYLGQQIVDHIGDDFMGKKVIYVDSLSPVTGSLGAFRFGVLTNEQSLDSDYILSNSDNILGKEFYRLLKNEIDNNRDSACFMSYPEPDKEKLKSQGVFEIDQNSNLIRVVEKSPIFVSDLSNVGLYYFPNTVRQLLGNKSPDLQKEELITDLMTQYLLSNPIKIIPCDDYYYSLSTVKDLTIARS
jgi:NDP-sugar pyrophosphorylase family protein